MPNFEDDPAEPHHIGAILPTIARRALAGKPQPGVSLRPPELDEEGHDLHRTRAEIVSLRFRRKGQDTLAHETNLARAAVWHARSPGQLPPGQLASVLWGQPFEQRAGPPLTTADERLFVELSTRWLWDGCPADLQVRFSLNEAAEVLGYSDAGGRQLALVKASLTRLRSATFHSVVRHGDGQEEDGAIWGPLAWAKWRKRRTGPVKGWVKLDDRVAELLLEENFTYLCASTWDRLRQRDDLAARLWTALEAEKLPANAPYWRFPLFARSSGKPTDLPPIAELLGLQRWAVRRQIAARVRKAVDAMESCDPRYEARIVKGAEPNTWLLEVRRRRETSAKAAAE